MAKIIVIQHVPYEILGVMNQLFKRKGVRIRYINFGRHPDKCPSVDGYDGMVILGGPMNVGEVDKYPHLSVEIKMIQEAMQNNIPILGICLGAQLIAKANGAEVSKNHCREIGWYDVFKTDFGKADPFFQHFNSNEKIFQWHGDTFSLPNNACLLAESNTCKNQAFKINENVYGFQFHLEVDHALIDRWLCKPAMLQELIESHGEITAKEIRASTLQYLSRSIQLSRLVFSEFVNLIGHKPKRKLLVSR